MDTAIFERFEPVTSETTGEHMFDFVGARTRVSFKKGWEKFAPAAGRQTTPKYPPANEHYFDWIATLNAVEEARGTFRMAELGAGWGPWLVRAALAARQRPAITRVELVGVEAEPAHFDWLRMHFEENGLNPDHHALLFGAASAEGGTLRFPVVEDPDSNYGASLRQATGSAPYIEVPGLQMSDILSKFSGPVDFMHVDIQGAEYDLLPASMADLRRHVKRIMIGTHMSGEKHDGLAALFREAGWREEMNFARNATSQTIAGDIYFDDGFLLFANPEF